MLIRLLSVVHNGTPTVGYKANCPPFLGHQFSVIFFLSSCFLKLFSLLKNFLRLAVLCPYLGWVFQDIILLI